eukprot:g4727.t1
MPKRKKAALSAAGVSPFQRRVYDLVATVPRGRVTTYDLTLGGFAGATGALSASVQRKRRMLEAEGVVFDAKGRAATDALHEFARETGCGAEGAKRQRRHSSVVMHADVWGAKVTAIWIRYLVVTEHELCVNAAPGSGLCANDTFSDHSGQFDEEDFEVDVADDESFDGDAFEED